MKRLYSVLYGRAGRNDDCWPSFATLAYDLGKSERQVRYDLAKLEKLLLVKTERRNRRRSNTYRFLWHEMFAGQLSGDQSKKLPEQEGEVKGPSTTVHAKGVTTQIATREWQDSAHLNGNPLPPNSLSEFDQWNSLSESPDDAVSGPSDDNRLPSRDQRPGSFGAEDVINWALRIAQSDPLLNTEPLPVDFLKDISLKLQMAKCTSLWGTMDLSSCPTPDLSFAAKIVEPWRGKGTLAFADWILSTVDRELGGKGRVTGPFCYGLYLSDSRAAARTWKAEAPMSFPVQDHFAEQERQAEQERRQKLMQTRVPVTEAINLLNECNGGIREPLNQRFVWLVERRFGEISPVQLSDEYTKWRSCRECRNNGIVGSPLMRTLRFCGCDIGQQERLDRGEDFLTGEIARVNGDIRTRLVAACRELRLDFTADALEHRDTTIEEQAAAVVIRPAKGFEPFVDGQSLSKALKYLNDKRSGRAICHEVAARVELQPGMLMIA